MTASPPPSKKKRIDKAIFLDARPPSAPSDETAAPALLTSDRSWTAAERITSQMPSAGIPLTILTGFLGAGKSTILNFILRSPHSLKFAVLINELGAIDIDSHLVDTSGAIKDDEPVTLDNGCICCTISNGFIDAIHRILDSSARSGVMPDYIIVETTGVADPKPIVDSIQETELSEEVYVDQVLTAVDSAAWTDDCYQSATARKQIEMADTILLTKTDLISDSRRLDSVIDQIYAIRSNARILRSQAGYVPLKAIFDLEIASRANRERSLSTKSGTAANSVGVSTAIKNESPSAPSGTTTHSENLHVQPHRHVHPQTCHNVAHSHKPGEVCRDHPAASDRKNHIEDEGFTSISFTSHQPLSLRRFRQDFMEQVPRGVFRAKGLLWFSSYTTMFVLHWSGTRFTVEERSWPASTEKSNQLVVIGRDLEHEKIEQLLSACVVEPGCESPEVLSEEGSDAEWSPDEDGNLEQPDHFYDPPRERKVKDEPGSDNLTSLGNKTN